MPFWVCVCMCLHLKVDTEVERWILSNRDKAFDDRAALTYLTYTHTDTHMLLSKGGTGGVWEHAVRSLGSLCVTVNPFHFGNKHTDRAAGVRWRRREEVYYTPTWHTVGGDCGWHTLGCHLLTTKRKRRRSRRIRGPVANDTAIPTGYRVQWQSKYHSKCVRSTEKPFHWDYTEWIIGYCRLYLSLNLNWNHAWLLLWFLCSYFCELYLPYLSYSFQFWLLLVFTGLCCRWFHSTVDDFNSVIITVEIIHVSVFPGFSSFTAGSYLLCFSCLALPLPICLYLCLVCSTCFHFTWILDVLYWRAVENLKMT